MKENQYINIIGKKTLQKKTKIIYILIIIKKLNKIKNNYT